MIILLVWDVLNVRTLSTTLELQRMQALLTVPPFLGTYYKWNKLRTRLTCIVFVPENTLRITLWHIPQLARLRVTGPSGGRS